mmetsp:Transcript_25126/g.72527  ORF Transcript_25126/g.72527 Transcript_25126/m.72527 type:complete len:236 (+) Transcript_25126:3063-3770(+)
MRKERLSRRVLRLGAITLCLKHQSNQTILSRRLTMCTRLQCSRSALCCRMCTALASPRHTHKASLSISRLKRPTKRTAPLCRLATRRNAPKYRLVMARVARGKCVTSTSRCCMRDWCACVCSLASDRLKRPLTMSAPMVRATRRVCVRNSTRERVASCEHTSCTAQLRDASHQRLSRCSPCLSAPSRMMSCTLTAALRRASPSRHRRIARRYTQRLCVADRASISSQRDACRRST